MNKAKIRKIINTFEDNLEKIKKSGMDAYKEFIISPLPSSIFIEALKALIEDEPEGIQEDEYGL